MAAHSLYRVLFVPRPPAPAPAQHFHWDPRSRGRGPGGGSGAALREGAAGTPRLLSRLPKPSTALLGWGTVVPVFQLDKY